MANHTKYSQDIPAEPKSALWQVGVCHVVVVNLSGRSRGRRRVSKVTDDCAPVRARGAARCVSVRVRVFAAAAATIRCCCCARLEPSVGGEEGGGC